MSGRPDAHPSTADTDPDFNSYSNPYSLSYTVTGSTQTDGEFRRRGRALLSRGGCRGNSQ